MRIELIDKNKIRADDYISFFLIISYLLFALFFKLGAIMAIIIYPLTTLAIHGVLKIIKGLNKKFDGHKNINNILLGIIYIIFSLLLLSFLFSKPNITWDIIISLIAFPILNAGFAGIVKGLIIDLYSTKHRVISIFIGIFTIVMCFLAFSSIINSFLFNVVLLSLTLLFNILSRAALYLSEYGLSLAHINNFKLFFYIINDFFLYIDRDGNITLSSIEEL